MAAPRRQTHTYRWLILGLLGVQLTVMPAPPPVLAAAGTPTAVSPSAAGTTSGAGAGQAGDRPHQTGHVSSAAGAGQRGALLIPGRPGAVHVPLGAGGRQGRLASTRWGHASRTTGGPRDLERGGAPLAAASADQTHHGALSGRSSAPLVALGASGVSRSGERSQAAPRAGLALARAPLPLTPMHSGVRPAADTTTPRGVNAAGQRPAVSRSVPSSRAAGAGRGGHARARLAAIGVTAVPTASTVLPVSTTLPVSTAPTASATSTVEATATVEGTPGGPSPTTGTTTPVSTTAPVDTASPVSTTTPVSTTILVSVTSTAVEATATVSAATPVTTATITGTAAVTATDTVTATTTATTTATEMGTAGPETPTAVLGTSGPTPSSVITDAMRSAYGALPLSFEANRGQSDAQVQFLARGSGYTLYLTQAGPVLVLAKSCISPAPPAPGQPVPLVVRRDPMHACSRANAPRPAGVALRFSLVGANPTPTMEGVEPLPGTANYFIGSDITQWITNVPTSARVLYHAVYPGVDMVYYGTQGRLEYDYQVAAGTDPSAIRLHIEGAQGVSLNEQGDLLIQTAIGGLVQARPHIYQKAGSVEQPISGGYTLLRGGDVGVTVGPHDLSRPLIIDPVLSYSTYLGGSNEDAGRAIAVDNAGNAYIAGYTYSSNFPTTTGAYSGTLASGSSDDAFVTKINAGGTARLYSTYLGGSGDDSGSDITVNSSGNAFITGRTSSPDFPTSSGVYRRTNAGGQDVFVTELNPTGTGLVFSTYVGGSGNDAGTAIARDFTGAIYVTGSTQSTNYPTVNPFQSQLGGTNGYPDVFVTKLDSTGSTLLYSTYLGGSTDDEGFGIAVDNASNAYVTGDTYGNGGFPTKNALQGSTGSPSAYDAFVAKFTTSGALVFSTYLGGNQDDDGFGIALDNAYNIYVTGDTWSSNFPTTANTLQTHNNGGTYDAFAAKLTSDGSTLLYGTYLGGGGDDAGEAISVDRDGNAYIAGQTTSMNFPATANAPQPHHGGDSWSSQTSGTTNALNGVACPSSTTCFAVGAAGTIVATTNGSTWSSQTSGTTNALLSLSCASWALCYTAGAVGLILATQDGADWANQASGAAADLLGISCPAGTTCIAVGKTGTIIATMNQGNYDAFAAQLNTTGSALLSSTYFGGSQNDRGYGLALDSNGNAYLTGSTSSTDLPLTPQAPQSSNGGGALDAFVVKLGVMTSGTVPWHPHQSAGPGGGGFSLGVDLADGHVDVRTAGLSIPSCGPALSFAQEWDSTLAQAGGSGLTSDLTPALGGVLTGTVVYTDSTGAQWSFPYTGTLPGTPPYTSYNTPPGLPWQLSTSTSGYTLTNILTGDVLTFTAQGRYGAATDAYGNRISLSYGANGPTSLTSSCGGRSLIFGYDAQGRLNDVQSPLWQSSGGAQGQHLTYGYTTSGQLTRLTRGAGTSDALTSTFGYSGTQLITATTPLSHAWILNYDTQGRVSYVLSPMSGTVGQAGYTPAYATVFAYKLGLTTVAHGYGAPGQQTTYYSLNGVGEPVAVTDGLGHTSYTTYDGDHDVTASKDANGNVMTNTYQYVGNNGAVGLVTQTVEPPIVLSPLTSTVAPAVTSYRYDPSTYDLLETDLPAGGVSKQTYNGHHDVASSAQLITGTTQWQGSLSSYDSQGNLSASTDGRGVTVSADGSSVTANTQATQYTAHQLYNAQGDQTAAGTPPITTTLNGATSVNTPVTTTTGYDSDGNPTSVTTPNGASTTMAYDHLGRQTSTTLPPVTLASGSIVQPVQSTAYDGEDHVVRQVNGNGDTTQSSYDPLGRLVASVNPVSGTQITTYNATELTATQDPVGNTSHYQYEGAGRLTQVTDPLTGTALYQYDPVGNTTVITSGDTSGGVIQVQTQQYNSRNQLTSAAATGPDGTTQTTTYGYDQDGNPTYQQDANGQVTLTSYDAADRPVALRLDPSAGVTGPQENYGYDPTGNMTRTVDMDGRVSTSIYDGDSRLLSSVSMTGTTTTVSTASGYDPNGNTITQTQQSVDAANPGLVQTHSSAAAYNAADWETSSTDDGLTTSYGYDAAGQLKTHTIAVGGSPVTFTLDPQGRATSESEVGGANATSFGYTKNDQVNSVDMPGGVHQGALYDGSSRVYSITAAGPTTAQTTTTLSSGYGYGYNAVGWTTNVTATVNGGPRGASYTQLITHNSLGRVTGVIGGLDAPESWAYNSAGSIISDTEGGATTVYTYNASAPTEQMAHQTLTPGRGIEYRWYDQHGNTTVISSTDLITTGYQVNTHLSYDAEQRPITITLEDHDASLPTTTVTMATVNFGYNALGQRSAYTSTTAGYPALSYAARMQYRDGQLAQAVIISGTATGNTTYTDTYIYDQGGNPLELIRARSSGVTDRYWYVLDGRGNVVALTDSAGKVVDRYSYDLWGEVKLATEDPTVRQQLRYAGYWYDTKLDWYWLSVRSYEPEGWFIQPDPSMIEGTRSYIYVSDDPIDVQDPSGLGGCGWLNIGLTCLAGDGFRLLGNGAQGAWNFVAGDDLATLQSNEPLWAKGLAVVDLGSNLSLVIPGVGEGVAGIKFVGKGAVAYLLKGGKAVAISQVTKEQLARLAQKRGLRWLANDVKKCGACFPAGTQVATAGGLVAINTLHVGDPVLAEDPQTGMVEAEPVQAVIAHPVWPLMAVDLSDSSTITVTVEHPFWVDLGDLRLGLGGWVLAGQLHKGDQLRTARGSAVQVVGLRYHVGRAAVYTLTVAKDHTFFVGAARVLVHNGPCASVLLARAMRDVRGILRDYPGWAAHHIVSAHEPNYWAKQARRLLTQWGIDVNDAYNGVFLPGVSSSKYHYRGIPGIHTSTYFRAVYYVLATAQREGATAGEAREILTVISQDLRAGQFPY